MKDERSLQELIDTYLSDEREIDFDKSVYSFRNKNREFRQKMRKRRQPLIIFDFFLLLTAALIVLMLLAYGK